MISLFVKDVNVSQFSFDFLFYNFKKQGFYKYQSVKGKTKE